MWGFMTGDVQRGMLFVPLGTPTPDFYGGSRKGSNLYGSSLVALDATTGKLKWYFQTTHHDNWDYDLTAAPSLIDVTKDGKKETYYLVHEGVAKKQHGPMGFCKASKDDPIKVKVTGTVEKKDDKKVMTAETIEKE